MDWSQNIAIFTLFSLYISLQVRLALDQSISHHHSLVIFMAQLGLTSFKQLVFWRCLTTLLSMIHTDDDVDLDQKISYNICMSFHHKDAGKTFPDIVFFNQSILYNIIQDILKVLESKRNIHQKIIKIISTKDLNASTIVNKLLKKITQAMPLLTSQLIS